MSNRTTLFPLLVVCVLVSSALVHGGQVGGLPTFSAGQSIRAADFNNAFTTFRDEINDNDARIGNLANLQTSSKSDLVAALNEVRQGQGVAGQVRMVGVPQGTSGGGTNSWTTGATLATASTDVFPAALVAGRPYTATIRFQTVDPTLGGDNAGMPLVGGNLVVDLVWRFNVDFSGALNVTVTQAAVATVVVDAGVNNDKSVTFTGIVPAAPTTPGGLATTLLGGSGTYTMRVNGATTAQGQAAVMLDLRVTP